ncbi:hypothetical protein [Patulibacter defluvii]|uniref:hypothetical protein n=1 Tax=Patulibacter defluvii TaxID=3095358 RepID=UPI002A7497CC|nr:hypothetical protein [Patulibacter sp. DM4]
MQAGFDQVPDLGRSAPATAAAAAVESALAAAGAPLHRPAAGEWGLAVECAGWPLHVGLALRGGLLRAQAEVCGPGRLDGQWLLHRNRRDLRLVRYATSSAGAVWVHGELPAAGLAAAAVDQLLGRLVEAATVARQRLAA